MEIDVIFVIANAAGEVKIPALLTLSNRAVRFSTVPMAANAYVADDATHFIERVDGTLRYPVQYDADAQAFLLDDAGLAAQYLPVRVRCISVNRAKAQTGADVKVFTLPGFTRESVTDYLVTKELGSHKGDSRYNQLRGKMLANDIREGRYVDSAHERSGVIVYDNYLTKTTTVFTLMDVKGG